MNSNDYGKKHQDHLLEQYKLYVEMADRVSQRRDQSNRFYVTIVSALAAIVVIISRFGVPENGSLLEVAFLVIGLFGLALSAVWHFNIRSYRTLNSAKFDIINSIEKQLPVAGYSDEWEILSNPPPGRPQYQQLTRVEQFVPVIFMALFAALTIYAIYLLAT
jgi:hypothetical protein